MDKKEVWKLILMVLGVALGIGIYYRFHDTSFVEYAYIIIGLIVVPIGLYGLATKLVTIKSILWILVVASVLYLADFTTVYLTIREVGGFGREINILMTMLGEYATWKLYLGYFIGWFGLVSIIAASKLWLKKYYYIPWLMIISAWVISGMKLINGYFQIIN